MITDFEFKKESSSVLDILMNGFRVDEGLDQQFRGLSACTYSNERPVRYSMGNTVPFSGFTQEEKGTGG